jgi:AraC-like DNA-binding protein
VGKSYVGRGFRHLCNRNLNFAAAPVGRLRHGKTENLGRHCHDRPFIALVLSGGYIEAGDEGRHRVRAGSVLLHWSFESHLDRFEANGAEVLILPFDATFSNHAELAGSVADPDTIVRMSENDPQAASRLLLETFVPDLKPELDWPDLLASDLKSATVASISDWSSRYGLRPETVSRGFTKCYGISPKAFRANARARAAVRHVIVGQTPMARLAAELGFSDQAHMTRAITSLTRRSARDWRRLQDGDHLTARLGPL